MTKLIPTDNEAYRTRCFANISSISFKHNFFKKHIFPINYPRIEQTRSLPSPNKIFQSHNSKEMKSLTRLRLGQSQFRECKFKHSFQDTLNPLFSYGLDIETTSHYFLYCLLFHAQPSTLLNKINEIFDKSDSVVTCILLYGNKSFVDEVTLLILNATIDFVLSTNRFDEPLYPPWIHGCFSFYS